MIILPGRPYSIPESHMAEQHFDELVSDTGDEKSCRDYRFIHEFKMHSIVDTASRHLCKIL